MLGKVRSPHRFFQSNDVVNVRRKVSVHAVVMVFPWEPNKA